MKVVQALCQLGVAVGDHGPDAAVQPPPLRQELQRVHGRFIQDTARARGAHGQEEVPHELPVARRPGAPGEVRQVLEALEGLLTPLVDPVEVGQVRLGVRQLVSRDTPRRCLPIRELAAPTVGVTLVARDIPEQLPHTPRICPGLQRLGGCLVDRALLRPVQRWQVRPAADVGPPVSELRVRDVALSHVGIAGGAGLVQRGNVGSQNVRRKVPLQDVVVGLFRGLHVLLQRPRGVRALAHGRKLVQLVTQRCLLLRRGVR